jgi:hypothetical protein
MPKLSAIQIEQGREHDFNSALPKRPKTYARKSDVHNEGYVKPPCDQCHGANHPPLQVLKYNPRRRLWLCEICR